MTGAHYGPARPSAYRWSSQAGPLSKRKCSSSPFRSCYHAGYRSLSAEWSLVSLCFLRWRAVLNDMDHCIQMLRKVLLCLGAKAKQNNSSPDGALLQIQVFLTAHFKKLLQLGNELDSPTLLPGLALIVHAQSWVFYQAYQQPGQVVSPWVLWIVAFTDQCTVHGESWRTSSYRGGSFRRAELYDMLSHIASYMEDTFLPSWHTPKPSY